MFLYWDSVSKSHTSCLKQKQKTSTTNKKWEKKTNKQKRRKPTHWDLDLFLFSHYLPFFISHLNNYMSSFLSLQVLFSLFLPPPKKLNFPGWVESVAPFLSICPVVPSACLCLQGLMWLLFFSYPLSVLLDLRPLFVPKGLPALIFIFFIFSEAFWRECLFPAIKIVLGWNMYNIDKCYINVYKMYGCATQREQKQVAVRCCGRKDKQMVTESALWVCGCCWVQMTWRSRNLDLVYSRICSRVKTI